MAVRVKDALNIGALAKCKVVAGEKGLNNPISFVGSMEVPNIVPWLTKDQLLATTGYSISDKPHIITELVGALHKASSAGLAIKTKFTGPIPKEAIDLANELGVPLIEIPNDVPFIELINPVMQAVLKNQEITAFNENMSIVEHYFFIDLIAGNVKNEEEASYRASNLKWPQLPLTLLSFDVDKFEELTYSNDELQLLNIKENILQEIKNLLEFKNLKFVIMMKSDSFTCLISTNNTNIDFALIINEVKSISESKFGISLSAGVSKPIYAYNDIKNGYKDVRDVISISRIRKDIGIEETPFISELILEQSMLNMGSNEYLKEFIDSTIGKLKKYDKHNKTELLKTFEVLILNVGNKTETAKQLFLHRNTLMYRIKKIEQLLDCDLTQNHILVNMIVGAYLNLYTGKK